MINGKGFGWRCCGEKGKEGVRGGRMSAVTLNVEGMGAKRLQDG